MHAIIITIITFFTAHMHHHIVDVHHYPVDTKRFEGLRLCPYRDTVGKVTVGYGHNVQGGSDYNLAKSGISRTAVLNGDCINQDEADKLYSLDMSDVSSGVSKLINNYNDQPIEVQLILNDMGFNLGIEGLSTFHYFLDDIQAKHYKDAANDLTGTKWHKQVKSRALIIERELRKQKDGN